MTARAAFVINQEVDKTIDKLKRGMGEPIIVSSAIAKYVNLRTQGVIIDCCGLTRNITLKTAGAGTYKITTC